MKTCSVCKQEKEMTEFGPKGKNKDGTKRLEARCRNCKREASKKHYESNKNSISAKRAEKRHEDLEGYNTYQRERYWANRDEKVKKMRENYHSNPEARKKQAARVMKYRKDNPEWWASYHRKKQAEWAKNNPEKARAHVLVHRARKNGNIKPPKYCQLCYEEKPLEGHHEDYDKPLDVVWLCKGCHDKITNIARLASYKSKRGDHGDINA